MLARKQGVIVNVSSASSRAPSPLLAVHAASHSFVEQLTKSLSLEYASHGVSFQCHSPMWIAPSGPEAGAKQPTSCFTPDAETYARHAVARLGREVVISPYPPHELMLWLQVRHPERPAALPRNLA